MKIDVDEMHAGATTAYNASWLAMEGKQRLARADIASGIFGGFAAADSFHAGITGTHTQHVNKLQRHETRLGDLGDQVNVAAAEFVTMENRNADALQAVLWSPIHP